MAPPGRANVLLPLGVAAVLAVLVGLSEHLGSQPAAAGLRLSYRRPPAPPAKGLVGPAGRRGRPRRTFAGRSLGSVEADSNLPARAGEVASPVNAAPGTARAGAILGALAVAAGVFGSVYTPVARTLFSSTLYELLFFVFIACTILWFLSPSMLAEKVYGMLRPIALRYAARGRSRRAAIYFAACHLASAATSAGQAFLAACLVVNALPEEAKHLLGGMPASGKWLTGPAAAGFLGPFLAPVGVLAAWSTKVLEVFIRRNTWLLLAAFLAPQVARFLLAATAPAPKVVGKGGAGVLAEALRTAAAAAVLSLGFASGISAVAAPMPPAYGIVGASVLAAAPAARDLAARALAALKKLPGEGAVVRGHVGGAFVSGRLTGFSGRYAEVELSDGSAVQIGAWAALEMLRKDRVGGQVVVPASGLAASLQEAEKLLKPKKKVLPKLAAVASLAGVLAAWPAGLQPVYALGVSIYLGRLIIPRMLVLVVTAVTALSLGPASTSTAYAIGAGFLLCSLLYPEPRPGPIAVCTGLDLAASKATVAWRAEAPAEAEDTFAEKLKAAAEDGASGKQADVGLAKERKVAKVKVLVSVIMLLLCIFFQPFVHRVEAATAKDAVARFVAFAAAAAVLLRLMLAGVMAQGAREVLPGSLAPLSRAPASVVSWFLAVNARAALVGAVMGLLLPMQGFIQGLAYKHGVIHQIHFIDAWLLKISTGALLAVVGVQATRLLLRLLPARPANALAKVAFPVGRAALCGVSALVLWHVVFLSIPGASIPGGSTLWAAVAAAALVGGSPGSLRDWGARLWFALAGGPAPGDAVWVAAEAGAVPGRLLRFEGCEAVVRLPSGEEQTLGAALLLGASRSGVRSVSASIPAAGLEEGASNRVAAALRSALKRQGPLLHRGPLAPAAVAAEDGALRVNAFVDRRLPPDDAWRLRSALLLEAARAAKASETKGDGA